MNVTIQRPGMGQRPEVVTRPHLALNRLNHENEQMALELLQMRAFLPYGYTPNRTEFPSKADAALRRTNLAEYKKIKRRESYRRRHGISLHAPVKNSGPKHQKKKATP